MLSRRYESILRAAEVFSVIAAVHHGGSFNSVRQRAVTEALAYARMQSALSLHHDAITGAYQPVLR